MREWQGIILHSIWLSLWGSHIEGRKSHSWCNRASRLSCLQVMFIFHKLLKLIIINCCYLNHDIVFMIIKHFYLLSCSCSNCNIILSYWDTLMITGGLKPAHYNDIIMGTIASQITSLMIVYSTVYSDADQRKHQSSAHWPLCGEFTGDRWIPRTKGQ